MNDRGTIVHVVKACHGQDGNGIFKITGILWMTFIKFKMENKLALKGITQCMMDLRQLLIRE